MKANYKRNRNDGLKEHNRRYRENEPKKETAIWVALVFVLLILIVINDVLAARSGRFSLAFNIFEKLKRRLKKLRSLSPLRLFL